VPLALQRETLTTFYLLALSLPAVLLTAGLGGVLAAYQRFKVINLIRMPMSILSFALPMAVLPYTHSLAPIVGSIVAVRFLGAALHLVVCIQLLPGLRREFRWLSRVATPLLKSGGWIAVINVIVPLFASADRVLVGAWTSVAAVAYYATPQELATKMWVAPGTLVGVLFPAFAANSRVDPVRVRALFTRGLKQVYCVLFPATMLLIVLGGDVLRAWLGAAFQQNGQAPMRFLVAGTFFTGIAFIPSALIQAVGQPRKVGVLLIIEIPLFLAGLWWGVRVAGPTGAAASWCVRALVDLVALMVLAIPLIPDGRDVARRLALPAIGTGLALAGAFAVQPLSFPIRVALVAALVIPFGIWVASRGLADERRAVLAGFGLRA
jgi:O-antigen/teichoic acid export membrane protein